MFSRVRRKREMSYRQISNGENRILNEYHIGEINHFKILLLCKMMWQMMLDRC
jgi:hypothetical protein